MMNRIVWLFVAFIALLVACSSNEAGGIRLHYSWTDAEGNDITPPDMGILYGWAELTYNSEKKSAGPVWMGDESAVMRFENLPYGPKMQLTITMRFIDAAGTDEDLIGVPQAPKAGTDNIAYRCTSQEFSLTRGKVTDVNNGCIMAPSAGVDPETGTPSQPELRIFDLDGTELPTGREATKNLEVNLCYKAPNATQVHIANKANFAGVVTATIPEATGGICPDGYHAYEGWNFEKEQLPTKPSDRIPWAIYLKASDDLGAETKAASIQFFIDNKAPVIVNQLLSPAAANGNSTVSIAISFQEPVTAVTLDTGDLTFTRVAPLDDEQLFIYEHPVTPTDDEGSYSFSVTATDAAGNTAELTLVDSLTIDRTLPDLTYTVEKNGTTVADATALYLKDADILSVALVLSEAPKDTPRVNLGTYPFTCTQGTDTEHYDCTLTIDKDTHGEGIADLTAAFEDPAGNPYAAPLKAGIRLDYTAPALTFQKNKQTDYNATEQILITVTAAEALLAITINDTEQDKEKLSWNITGVNTTGSHTITAGATDLAGNILAVATIGTYIVDATYPTATVGAPTPTRISGTGSTTIAVSDPTEAIVNLKLNGTACTGTGPYTCTYDAPAGTEDTTETLVVSFSDTAGNTSSITKTVQIDRTRPALTITTNKDSYNAADQLIITVSALETLTGDPVVTLDGNPITGIKEGNSWTYSPALTGGSHAIAAVATDLAGNTTDPVVTKNYTADITYPSATITPPTPARVQGNTPVTFTVSKSGDEELDTIKVRNNDGSLSDCPGGTCHYTTAIGTIGTDTTETVMVQYADAAGNTVTESAGTVYVDRTLPDAMAGTAVLSIDAGPDCALTQAQVTTLASGSTAYLSSQVSEKLEDGYTPVLTARKAGAPDIVFDLDTHSGLTYYFSYPYDEAAPTAEMIGAYTLTLTLKDEAGNETTVALNPDKPFRTAWNDPTLVVDQNLVSYTRSPWGRSVPYEIKDDDENVIYTIPANEYYEIGTADLYAKTDRLPAGAFTLDYGTATGAPAQLRAWDRDGNYLALAKNKPNGDGSWPRTRIYSYDSSEVFISAIDSSCRETGTVKIQNVNWVASMNRKQASKPTANPHEYQTTRFFDARLGQAQRFLTEPEVYNPTDGLLTINTPTVFTATDYNWEIQSEQGMEQKSPMCSAAYNRARGKVQRMNDENIYERNGESWDLLGPWPGGGHYYSYSEYYSPFPPYAYDIANERGVLFGGGYEEATMDCMSVIYYVLNDRTYEMDKTGTWALKEPANKPAARMCHAMAYDPLRGKTVLFGGQWMDIPSSEPFPDCLPTENYFNDTWEWNGVDWTQRAGATCTGGDCYLCESDSCPASGPCRSAAMVYDDAREKMLLVSANTLWAWNGTGWAILNSTPFATYRPAIAYDSLSGQVVLYDSTKTAAWDGAAWVTMSPALVPNVDYPTSVYDEGSQETLLGGEPRSGSYSTIWRWRGSGHEMPGQIFTVAMDHSKISEYTGVTFRSVTANFDTGGIGDVAGAATDGATLLFWHDDAWHDIATNEAGIETILPLQKSIANEETDIQTLLDANGNSISFAVTPTAPRGFGTVTGEVVTDYAEVVVRYQIQ